MSTKTKIVNKIGFETPTAGNKPAKKTITALSKREMQMIDIGDGVMKPSLMKTLVTLQFLRTAKNATESEIHAKLDEAYAECKAHDEVLVLERIMLHIGDVSRHHNILREMGIKSTKGGAQERKIFRSILRWWEKNLPESFKKNIRVFAEFTLYENLMFYQITSDRNTGKIKEIERLFPMPDAVHQFLAERIRKGKDLNLIARHLPKYETGTKRTTRRKMKARRGEETYKWTTPKNKDWVEVNGKRVEPGTKVQITAGDIVRYSREKQAETLEKQEFVNSWIRSFCDVMDWTIADYKNFRKQQNTPEQKFSSKAVLGMAKSDFMEMLDRLTAGQRMRVARQIAYKDQAGMLQPKEKWGDLGKWYSEWENNQAKVAEKIREAAASGDEDAKKELKKQFKVKSTGMQSIDLLAKMYKGGMTDEQINNTYDSLIENMDLIANVFPVIDGSASMNRTVMHDGVNISYRQMVYTLAIAFATRNPVDEFRNTFGWFSNNFHIVGNSKFKDTRPNPYLARNSYMKKTKGGPVLKTEWTFTENFNSLRQSDPKEVASTNMFATIEYFVKLVQKGTFHVEDLPQAILFLSDNEYNTGKSPSEAQELAASIGWCPLLIFWGIQRLPDHLKREMEKSDNCLAIGGFSESALSQILRGIKTGTVNPQLEIWSIYNDRRYSVLK